MIPAYCYCRVPGVGFHMAARFVMGCAAAHGSCGGCAVRTRVGRQAQAVHCIAQVFSARSQQRHARFHSHYGVVGLIGYMACPGLCFKNQVIAGHLCSAFALERRANLVRSAGDGSHAVAEISNQRHLLIGFQRRDIREVDLRRIHIRTCKGNIGRTGHQGAAVLPNHVAKGQLRGLVRRWRIGHNSLAGGKPAGDVRVNRHTGKRCETVSRLFYLRRHIFQRCIRLQQRHGFAGRYRFRRGIGNGKAVRAKGRYFCIIILRTAAVQQRGIFYKVYPAQRNRIHIFLNHSIYNMILFGIQGYAFALIAC